jgi:ABC-type transport system, involved in lipoprotein release, permease component
MRLAFRIALRFLSSSKGQTVLIALGIAIGISVQIFIGSLIEGLQISLLDSTIGSSPHITISAAEKNDPVDNYLTLKNKIDQQYPEVSYMTPSISGGAFMKTNDKTQQILLRGFELDLADDIYKISDKLIDGSMMPSSDDEILLGISLAEEFDVTIGETIDILTATGEVYPAKVVGYFDLKVASINQSWIISPLAFSQNTLGLNTDQVTSLEIQIDSPFDADILATQMLGDNLSDQIRIDNWKDQNEQLLSGLSGQSTSSLMIQVFVVISVVLGIASVLAITVLQKSRQIGILKAMGINDKTSSLVFLFQGFILGILGGILGILFGLGLLVVFTKFALNPDGTPVVPIFINMKFIGLSGFIAVAASTLASIIPALKSRKLSPIEVIKNG